MLCVRPIIDIVGLLVIRPCNLITISRTRSILASPINVTLTNMYLSVANPLDVDRGRFINGGEYVYPCQVVVCINIISDRSHVYYHVLILSIQYLIVYQTLYTEISIYGLELPVYIYSNFTIFIT